MLHSVAVIVESPGSLECSNAALDGLLGVVLFGFLLFFKFISKSAWTFDLKSMSRHCDFIILGKSGRNLCICRSAPWAEKAGILRILQMLTILPVWQRFVNIISPSHGLSLQDLLVQTGHKSRFWSLFFLTCWTDAQDLTTSFPFGEGTLCDSKSAPCNQLVLKNKGKGAYSPEIQDWQGCLNCFPIFKARESPRISNERVRFEPRLQGHHKSHLRGEVVLWEIEWQEGKKRTQQSKHMRRKEGHPLSFGNSGTSTQDPLFAY